MGVLPMVLSTGAIVGIVFALHVVLLLIGWLTYAYIQHMRQAKCVRKYEKACVKINKS